MHLAGALSPGSAQQVDGPALGDGPQPGAERTAGIVRLARAMDGQQHVLHDILDIGGGNAPARGDGPDQGHAIAQQRLIGGTIAALRRRHLGGTTQIVGASELRLGLTH